MCTYSNNLIFGIVAPIGADIDHVQQKLNQSLMNCGYEVREIRLSDHFDDLFPEKEEKSKSDSERKRKIEDGNKICKTFNEYLKCEKDSRQGQELKNKIFGLRSIELIREERFKSDKLIFRLNILNDLSYNSSNGKDEAEILINKIEKITKEMRDQLKKSSYGKYELTLKDAFIEMIFSKLKLKKDEPHSNNEFNDEIASFLKEEYCEEYDEEDQTSLRNNFTNILEKYFEPDNIKIEDFSRDFIFFCEDIRLVLDIKNLIDEINVDRKKAFIIRQFKRPEELQVLRETYRENFFLIGIHAPLRSRINELSRNNTNDLALSQEDREKNKDDGSGQNITKTFFLSDFFVDQSCKVEEFDRFLKIIFRSPYNSSPTKDEHFMNMAFNASLRSSELSRQVGAVIVSDKWDIISEGCNEVPKFGGGIYDDPNHSFADNLKGYDSNANEINNLRDDFILILKNKIKNKINENDLDEIIDDVVDENIDIVRKALRDAGYDNITEYGRVVHAEMNAILSCARRSISTQDTTMYVTLFSCHNCAKHMLSAGINKVIYIEPYPKNKSYQLHNDAIYESDDPTIEILNKMNLRPFVGVSPMRYRYLFWFYDSIGKEAEKKDKKDGTIKPFYIHAENKLNFYVSYDHISKKENEYIEEIKKYKKKINKK